MKARSLVATCMLAACWLAPTVAAAGERRFAVGPEPAWAQPLVIDPGAAPAADGASGGVELLLSDLQLSVDHQVQRRYFRLAQAVRSSEGLETVSHLSLDFDPAYEHLTIHYVRVLRGGQTINVLKPAAIKVIQAERDLSDEQYSGRLTALIVVDDLRVGDVLDYAATIEGANQILGDHLSFSFSLGFGAPVRQLRRRLLVADERPVFTRTHGSTLEPSLSRQGGVREYLWTRARVPAVERDDELPSWFDPDPWVQVTDFSSWNEVARWASGLFAGEHAASPELTAQIERWLKTLPTPAARVEAALSFVRNDVRYFGVEIGQNSHEPHRPSEVFAQRFGDCKDKAMLLVAILRGLGVDAQPALTDTTERRALDRWLPSARAFNHAIVRMRLGERTYWLDPTRRFQRGTLEHLAPLPYERALVVAEHTTALSDLTTGPPSEPLRSVEEHYSQERGGAVLYDVVTRYRGSDAESKRGWLTEHSPEQIQRIYLNYYLKHDPGIEPIGKPAIEDDTNGNTIVVSEHYRLPAFWKNDEHQVVAAAIEEVLNRPHISRRTMPFAIGDWLSVEHRIRIDLPDAAKLDGESRTIEDDAVRFSFVASRSGGATLLEYRLRALADAVEAKDIAHHLSVLDDIEGYLGYRLARAGDDRGDGESLLVLGIIVGLALLVVGGRFVAVRVGAWRRRRRLEKRVAQSAGEAPATAIPAADPEEVAREVTRRGCRCQPDGRTVEQEDVHYGGQVLTVVRLVCATCGLKQRLYFSLRT